MKQLPWADFKTFITDRSVPIHEQLTGADYYLEAFDGPLQRSCKLSAGSSDATDYETNYQADANVSFTDSNGTTLARTKITQSGWHYQMYNIEFETAKLGSLINLDVDNSPLGHANIKFYNSSDVELTTQLAIDLACVKTVIDWEPPWDYEIIGGQFRQLSIPGTTVRLHVVAVPDLTPAQGGSVPFVNNLNLKYVGNEESVSTDGRTSKRLNYDATYHTNKIRIILEHDILVSHKMLVTFDIFRA